MVRRALLKFPAGTASGADGWILRQLADIPEATEHILALQLTALRRSMVMPEAQAEA